MVTADQSRTKSQRQAGGPTVESTRCRAYFWVARASPFRRITSEATSYTSLALYLLKPAYGNNGQF